MVEAGDELHPQLRVFLIVLTVSTVVFEETGSLACVAFRVRCSCRKGQPGTGNLIEAGLGPAASIGARSERTNGFGDYRLGPSIAIVALLLDRIRPDAPLISS
jgi:hypothetical protein